MTRRDRSLYEVKARMIGVLSNPRRLELIDILSSGEKTVNELVRALALTQAATSQHLAIMRKAGLLRGRREANRVYYRLASPRMAAACGVMNQAVAELLREEHRRLTPILEAL
jgi:ArsR family transcriptional regulator